MTASLLLFQGLCDMLTLLLALKKNKSLGNTNLWLLYKYELDLGTNELKEGKSVGPLHYTTGFRTFLTIEVGLANSNLWFSDPNHPVNLLVPSERLHRSSTRPLSEMIHNCAVVEI